MFVFPSVSQYVYLSVCVMYAQRISETIRLKDPKFYTDLRSMCGQNTTRFLIPFPRCSLSPSKLVLKKDFNLFIFGK